MLISAKSIEDCISVERLNTLYTDLQSILQNINKLQPAKQGLLSQTAEAAVHMNFVVNFAGFFRTPFLHNIQ